MQVNPIRTLSEARNLTLRDGAYLAVAVKELLFARLRHARQPAGLIVQTLRLRSQNGESFVTLSLRPDLERMAWAIAAAAVRVPWRSDCLVRVMAADRWLRRRGLTGNFHLGVRLIENEPFAAHAWLTCGDINIAGGSGVEFTELVP